MSKVSGPLLDRIDLHIEVPAVKYKELSSKESGESSEKIRARVMQAREIQVHRFNGRKGLYSNADMQSKDIRAYDRILKVGITIADMAGSADIRPEHISEAIQYRSLDRNLTT
jgi:magnesium chelatase family protein